MQCNDAPDRTKRVKEARDEAKKEIEAYRAKKEAEYKKFEAEVRSQSPFPSGSRRESADTAGVFF